MERYSWLILHTKQNHANTRKWVPVIHFESCCIGRTARHVGPGPGDYTSLRRADRFLASSLRRRRNRSAVVPDHSAIMRTFRPPGRNRGWHRDLSAQEAYPLK